MTSEAITICLPILDQKREFLEEAVESVLDQTSPDWRLLACLDVDTPDWIHDLLTGIDDERIDSFRDAGKGIGAALNECLRRADTPFVCILLSDDRLHPSAIKTLLRARRQHPDADFFHSSRRKIGPDGAPIGNVVPSRRFELSHFVERGSPVKHLLCWRRDLALEIGGMREHLGPHGCDDFDFPWRMAEAGASFFPIPECLYEYRVHTHGPRLTTDVALETQVLTLETMFREHEVPEDRLAAFLDQAIDGYLPMAHAGEPEGQSRNLVTAYREADDDRAEDFLERGLPGRHFFPHRVYTVPRNGPDGLHYARRMCGVNDPGMLRQLLVFAPASVTGEFPSDLFFDDDIVWHQQQLGLPGLIAHANLVLLDDAVHVTLVQSDLVQRISRRRELKTRIENRFRGWAHLTLNGVLNFAADRGAKTVLWPTSSHVLRFADPARDVKPALFERVYDATVNLRHEPESDGDWWRFDVESIRDSIVRLDRRVSVRSREKTICIIHDIERGMGHTDDEPAFVEEAERVSPDALEEMLRLESQAEVRTTYNVVGTLLPELRERISADGHALAFHSYQHAVWKRPRFLERIRNRLPWTAFSLTRLGSGIDYQELLRCREVDYRLKGYRPPQSRVTPGLNDTNLALNNFEWLASSSYSLSGDKPWIQNGLVKIPVHIDDFDLHRRTVEYEEWEEQVFELIDGLDLTVIGLHDCYGPTWLPHYGKLLDRLCAAGSLETCDGLAASLILGAARWQ